MIATTDEHSPARKGAHWRWGAAVVTASLAAVMLCMPGLAAAQSNSINDIVVSKGTAGRTIVKFAMKAPLANPPAGFSTVTPPRIALDFPDTANGIGTSLKTVDDASLRSLNLVQAGGRTRVVFNLNKAQSFETAVQGNDVLVTLVDQGDVVAAAQQQQVQRFAEARPGDVQHALRDIDFRRGRNGEGRIMVDLSDNSTGIDIRQQGRTLVVDFIKTSLPRNLQRRLDVQDFGTPVLNVDTFPQGANTRMVIEPRGLWEHSAYQADNKFIIEVKPIQEDPNRLTQGTRGGYKGERLSLNFQNVEVRSVLQVIADFTGLNIITSDTVGGSLTLRLKDIPWDQALDIILQTKGLDMRKNGNVVLIAPREEIALREKQQLEAAQQIGDLEPVQTEMFQLNYAKAADILALVSARQGSAGGTGPGGGGSILSKRGTATLDPRSNILFVQDIPSRLEEVRKIIRQVDVSVRQVLIEARIVVASDTFSRQLGVRFGQQTGFTFANGRYSVGSTGSLTTPPSVHTEGDRLVRDTITPTPFEIASPTVAPAGYPGYSDVGGLNVNLPVSGAAGQLALTLINLGSGNLINLELSALEAENRGKVISSPRVVAFDNTKAHIEQGTDIPYIIQGTNNTVPTVQFKKAVLALDVTPQITPDNRVIMTVEVRKDAVGQTVVIQGSQYPAIDTKNVTTQIAVNNGDTAVIGGIYEETIRNDTTKVPFLGDLPVLGYLFKTTGRSSEKTELLIFLTPRIVKDTVNAVR